MIDLDKWTELGWQSPISNTPSKSLYYMCLYWNMQYEKTLIKALAWDPGNDEKMEWLIKYNRDRGDYGTEEFNRKYNIRYRGFQWWDKDRTRVVPQYVYCFWPVGSENYCPCGKEQLIPTPYVEDFGGYYNEQRYVSARIKEKWKKTLTDFNADKKWPARRVTAFRTSDWTKIED